MLVLRLSVILQQCFLPFFDHYVSIFTSVLSPAEHKTLIFFLFSSFFLHFSSFHRKSVNMNKTPITYRQEKSHMGSMERSFTDQSTLQEDERMALSFMDAHTCGSRSKTCCMKTSHSTVDKKHPRELNLCLRK